MRWEVEDTPEQAEFRAEFKEWLRENLAPGWIEAVESGNDDAFEEVRTKSRFNPFEWSGKIGRSRFAAPLWPKDYGGLSGEPWMVRVIRSELVRYRLPTVSVNLLGVGLAGPTIIEHGTEAQKERYLQEDPLRRGDLVPALQRAGLRIRPCLPLHPRSPRRRRMDHQRPEGLDIDRAALDLRHAARPQRSRRP